MLSNLTRWVLESGDSRRRSCRYASKHERRSVFIAALASVVCGCTIAPVETVALYYREPTECEYVGTLHEESKSSYEDALKALKRSAASKGGNLIRLEVAPNEETFIGGSGVDDAWVITQYAEGKLYTCTWQ